MRVKQKYKLYFAIKELVKYVALFALCYSFLFLDLNFFIVLFLIVSINIIFIKFELKYHLATKLAKLIREEKFEEALQLGLSKNAAQRDDFSKLLMIAAYYKTGNKLNALKLLKNIDSKRWKTKKVQKIVDNWKVKILLESPYQLN